MELGITYNLNYIFFLKLHLFRPRKIVDPKIFCVSYTKDGVYVGAEDDVEWRRTERIRTAWGSQGDLQHSISLPDLRLKHNARFLVYKKNSNLPDFAD